MSTPTATQQLAPHSALRRGVARHPLLDFWVLLYAGAWLVYLPLVLSQGLPNFIFESPPFPGIVAILPVVLGMLGIAMLVFSLVVWWKRYWTLGGRLFYTFLTISAAALLWALMYWNFLL